MNVRPATDFTSDFEAAATGLVGTIAVGVYQGDTAVDALHTTGINEIGTTGVYVATLTSPDDAGQYTIIWSLDGTLSPDQLSIDDLTVTFSAPGDAPTGDTYATASELARILKIRNPSTEQTAALERVLLTATGEINDEIDSEDDPPDLTSAHLALVQQVCLDRAADLWRHTENAAGVVGLLGDETTPSLPGRYSWERYSVRLSTTKERWGIA